MKETILIIDSGGTKADWVFKYEDNILRGHTLGIHPNFLDQGQIEIILQGISIEASVDTVFFYGAGCMNPDNRDKIQEAIINVFHTTKVEVAHDLLGAARAGLADRKGNAVILGTGSVGAYYDGETIQEIIGGHGYLFGDEGSGAYLGKLLIQGWLRGEFSEALDRAIYAHVQLEKSQFITKVYRSERPNKILADLTYFIHERKDQEEIKNIIEQSFAAFDTAILEPLLNAHPGQEIAFIGGIASHFKGFLEGVLENYEVNPVIIQKPIEALLSFHIKKA